MKIWRKKGAEFEDFVAYVYQSLLEINDCTSIVSKRAKIKGTDGLEGEIDVYYEFVHLNITYRVAIECKDWKTPVTAKEVRDFSEKIDRISNVAGVMISTSGYQSGAREWAQRKGIILMEDGELPTFNQILAGKIAKVFLPNEKVLGEPFWTLMELRDGEVTGVYYNSEITKGLPLFFSPKTAEDYRMKLGNRDSWCVRGITQRQLRTIIAFAERYKWDLSFCPLPMTGNEIYYMPISVEMVKMHYIWDMPK